MKCRFGEIENNEMVLNEFGIIAYDGWLNLLGRFPNIELDEFQIMPNHMHGIIVINEFFVGAGLAPDLVETRDAATIGDIIGAYKSLVANECLAIFKSRNEIMCKLWQRDYYEHIISDERSYHEISNYIIANVANWNDDKFFIV
ncbi:MAG: transposase [Chitinophagaceae bacterium]